MLLVDDRETETLEGDAFLKQRVRADRDVDFTRRHRGEGRVALPPALAAGDEHDTQARRFGERRDRRVMLPGENFGRRH